MSVREYIGARYVPLFIGDWDNTVTYEPLSIVQYQGNSYTSRQYVPAGIDISNTTYWASTGNYNAQIEQYRQEVLTYSNRITSLENGMESVNGDIQIIEADNWVTTDRISDDAVTTDKIADDSITMDKIANGSVDYDQLANGAVSPSKLNSDTIKRFWAKNISIQGTNMVVFGDSYTADNIANSINAYWPKRVSSVLGTNLFNFAIAGAGFGRAAQPISNQQTNCAGTMTTDEARNTSIVICLAGCNDLLNDISQTDINSGINGFMTWASNFFPYAEIYIIPFNWGFSKLTKSHNVLITNVLNSIMTYSAQRIHIIPFAWCWNLGIASRFQNEVHPNMSGYNNISAHILAAINGVENNAFNTGNVIDFSSVSDINSGYLEYNMRNGVLLINGYIRPTNAGQQFITLRAANAAPAIITPNDSLFVMPLVNSTQRLFGGLMNIVNDGRITVNLPSNTAVNDVFAFNGTFIPEVGVNWSDYN